MNFPISNQHRRRFLQGMAFSAAAFTTPGLFADLLTPTPLATEGPFYPDKLPLDTDNDLLIINDTITPAVGQITHLTGKVTDINGQPIRNALVEIWQCDGNGVYLHTRSSNSEQRDGNFQGFGRFMTNRKGEYYFRTIKPVPYPGRTPHIHVAVKLRGKKELVTQLYDRANKERNERDGLFKRIKDPNALANVLVDFKPIPESKLKEVAAEFHIVMGRTPQDADHA